MIALLMATVFSLCGSTSPGVACTCVPGPPLTSRSLVRQAAGRYHTVLEGTVVNIEYVRPPKDSAAGVFPLDEVVATIRVTRSWRGDRAGTVVVRTALQTTACGLGFRTGDHYLLFARRADGKLYADKCGPSRTWDEEAKRLARWLGRGRVAPVSDQTEAPKLPGSWQLRLWVTGPAAESAGPREARGHIEVRRPTTGPVPRGLQWVYNVTYDTTLHVMLGPPQSGPARAVLRARDSVELAFNPLIDHGAFRLTGVVRGDSIVGSWHRTSFADDGYRGSFTMVRRVAGQRSDATVPVPQDYAGTVMAGLSNHGRNGGEPYVTAGDRAYLIGTQDGNFPDLGDHVPGEMGGLWLHPIKLIDGFWATVRDSVTGQVVALSKSTEFVNYPYGNRLRYRPVLDGVEIERFQFSPDGQAGVIVQYTFTNSADRQRRLSFQLSVKTDLSPVWFSDRLGIKDASDTVAWEATNGFLVARDTRHRWFAVWGGIPSAGAERVVDPEPVPTRGMGVTAASRHSLSVDPHATATLTFVFAGSATARKAAENTYTYLARHHASLLSTKKAYYATLLDKARIRIPDRRLQEVYNWVKVNAEWLVRDIPGMGRGLGGGFMEYPWWFGTETYSLQALLAAGNADLAKQTLRLLKTQSTKANGNGRIVHEVTTNGAVSNPGNTQETAQFILTVGKVFQWTGDLNFAREMYPAMKQGLHWLLTDMDRNHNLFPEGYGITEIYGLNAELIDVAVYTQQALVATAELARILGEPKTARRYQRLAQQLEVKINDRFWVPEEGSYADFYGTRAQAISAAEGAVKQIGLKGADRLTQRDRELIGYYDGLKAKFAGMPDGSRGWITNKNWVITTPMEMGIAPRERALSLLDRMRKDVGEYGPYLSTVDKQAMMTISTGVLAVSEANYGRTDQALWYVDKIVQTFNRKLPGSISEMMPDYGCFTIAWTSYGIVVPLVQHVFGIQPDAMNKSIVFDPHPPKGWEDMSIEDVPVGTNLISFSRAQTEQGIHYRIEAKQSGWTFVLKGNPLPGAKYYVNGRPVAFTASGIRMSGRKNLVLVVPQ